MQRTSPPRCGEICNMGDSGATHQSENGQTGFSVFNIQGMNSVTVGWTRTDFR